MSLQMHPLYDIAQYVADGEPSTPAYWAVRAHLYQCAACRELKEKLILTEAALRAYPVESANPTLRPNVSKIITETQTNLPEWKLLPWTVWVPIITFVVATITTLLLVPPEASTPLGFNLGKTIVMLPKVISAGLRSVHMYLSRDTLLTILGAIAAILGGTGMLWAVSSLSPEQDEELEHIGSRVADSASQFLHFRRD